jgi:two-component system, NtrC family, response regulator HydG
LFQNETIPTFDQVKKLAANVLIVDDDPDIVQSARVVLRQYVNNVYTTSNPEEIPFLLNQQGADVVLLDMNFTTGVTKGSEGLFWLKQITSEFPEVSVVMITAYADVKLAVEAMKSGAIDFVIKPWDNDRLVATVTSAYNLSVSKKELNRVRSHQSRLSEVYTKPENLLIGESEAMMEVKNSIIKLARTDANILLLGENGTGKDLVAKSIHQQSHRSNEPFIKVDVGSIPATLFESELFGHKKGAFTDARANHVGRFELASGGTLFLDEIGNIPPSQQIKLLTALQNREIMPLGGSQFIKIDVRLISATNQPLQQMIREGVFREDLLYRINTVEITLPPLRERIEDIPMLLAHFLNVYGKKYQKALSISNKVIAHLSGYRWPGNVREFQHAVERAVIMTEHTTLEPHDFLFPVATRTTNLKEAHDLDSIERKAIEESIRKNKGNISKAAQELGLGRTTLYRKIQKYGL